MRPFQTALVAGSALALSACATRGAIDVSCAAFEEPDSRIVYELPQSALARQIQQEGRPSGGGEDKLSFLTDDEALVEAIGEALGEAFPEATGASLGDPFLWEPNAFPSGRALLLSGGGQWGSFGASFLHELYTDEGAEVLDYQFITGVSTGGLQSIFVAVGDEIVSPAERARFEAFLAAQGHAKPTDEVRYIDLLQMNYTPSAESDIVDRNSQIMAVATGSFAGLKPLRERIETALCQKEGATLSCPLIDRLAKSKKVVLIGFIRADDGKFMVADAVAIARLAQPGGNEAYRAARDCLTGAALASAAMPVTFQQVRVERRTFLDGGVRQSVFDAGVTGTFEQALDNFYESRGATPIPLELYVIRNGPTMLASEPNFEANEVMGVHEVAQTAQAIVVNELEVGSIAGLRLDRPTDPIWLVTADGYNGGLPGWNTVRAKRNKGIMFDPQFMACLREFGRFKANRELPTDPAGPWLRLGPIVAATEDAASGEGAIQPQAGSRR